MHASHAQQLACGPLRERYQEIRRTTLELSKPYSAEDQMLQSMPDASPMKWHLAHTTWFFETFILAPNVPGYRPFDPRFKQLFNSYYKQLGSHPYRGARGLMSRPSLDEIRAYRQHVDQAMLRYLEVPDEKTAALIEVGLNHEQQHQELILTDMKHALWSMPLRPEGAGGPRTLKNAEPLHWIEFEGGIREIGHEGSGFSFDNEGPRHEVLLTPFKLACHEKKNGTLLPRMLQPAARSLSPKSFVRNPRQVGVYSRCSAMSGSGPRAPTLLIQDSHLPQARSANITASSCVTSTCCAA